MYLWANLNPALIVRLVESMTLRRHHRRDQGTHGDGATAPVKPGGADQGPDLIAGGSGQT